MRQVHALFRCRDGRAWSVVPGAILPSNRTCVFFRRQSARFDARRQLNRDLGLNAKSAGKDVAEKQMADWMSRVRTRITIEAEKKQYFIGEEIYVNHVPENVGKVSYEYMKGGDYRGATRHLSYYIEAVHEDGTAMPDPDPNQMCFGGLGSHGKTGARCKRYGTSKLTRISSAGPAAGSIKFRREKTQSQRRLNCSN